MLWKGWCAKLELRICIGHFILHQSVDYQMLIAFNQKTGACDLSESDAIAALHQQLDKDQDGVITGAESSRVCN
jgi:hypothetical protein